jgi:hypothetical protein
MSDITDIDTTDPRMMLIEIDKQIRPTLVNPSTTNEVLAVRGYFYSIRHAYSTLGEIQFPLKEPSEWTGQTANQVFSDLKHTIEKLKIDALYEKSHQNDVVLDVPWRERIHGYLANIRVVVESAGVSPVIRDRILSTLNSLAKEVDRGRAPMEKFTTALVGVCQGISEGATALTPAVRLLERVIGALARVKSSEKPPLALPKPDDFGLGDSGQPPQLPPPDSTEISN